MDEEKSWQNEEKDDNNNSPRKRRKKGNPFMEFLQLYGKYIVMGLIAILIVAAVIVVVGKMKKTSGNKDTTVIDVNTGTSSEEKKGGQLEKDMHPEINTLVNSYFTAVQNCDVDSMSKLVASTEPISLEQLQAEKEFVESYKNIVCYTVKGLLDGTYITYVSYDMKFLNVETPAPCLIRLYICPNDAGELYIYNLELDGEIASYMEEVNARDDVKALSNEVDTKLTEAMAGDEALNALVTKLRGAQGETPADSTETTAPAETTPTETTPEAPTEAPTTAAPVDNTAFTDVDETVYAKENVKMRKTPSADGEVAGTLAGGQSVHRTGYNDGWSRVEVNGETCYIAAGYLTMAAPGENPGGGFTEVDERVYAKETVRIRRSPEENAEVVGSLLSGESIRRTGYNDGWSRVIYEGETCYIGAGFLTTADPSEEE